MKSKTMTDEELEARIERLEAKVAKLRDEIICVGVYAMIWICVLCLLVLEKCIFEGTNHDG